MTSLLKIARRRTTLLLGAIGLLISLSLASLAVWAYSTEKVVAQVDVRGLPEGVSADIRLEVEIMRGWGRVTSTRLVGRFSGPPERLDDTDDTWRYSITVAYSGGGGGSLFAGALFGLPSEETLIAESFYISDGINDGFSAVAEFQRK